MQLSYRKVLFRMVLIPLVGILLIWRFSPWTRSWVRQFFYPYERTVTGLNEARKDAELQQHSKDELIAMIRELQEVNRQNQKAREAMRVMAEENYNLRQQLDAPLPRGFSRVSGHLISRDPAKGGRVFRIDRGERAGIVPGCAVLSGGSLIGRVSNVTWDTCEVHTLIDPACRIPARIQGVKAYGILTGAGEEGWKRNPFCRLSYLPRDLEYTEGMEVQTSEYSRFLPAGLTIGTIHPRSDGSMIHIANNLYVNVWIKPTAFDDDFGILTILVPKDRTTEKVEKEAGP